MRILFAVSNDNITTSVINKYQQKFKEIVTSKNVYYFNAIIKELQKNKSYDAIVIGEDLEPISNNNYDAIDKFLFEKLDGISDEASKPTGEDIPIIFICSERRRTSDQLLSKLFGIGIYNAIIGNDRSIDTVCNLINKPRSKKEAKIYYKIETDDVEMYENSNQEGVSETEIQNILSHYKKIGSNVRKCVESFDKIAEQYDEAQLRVIINFFPNEVKEILNQNSNTYRKLMSGGTALPKETYSPYNSPSPKKSGESDILATDLEKTQLSKPVIIPPTININNRENQGLGQNSLANQNMNNRQMQQYGGMTQGVMQVRPRQNMMNNPNARNVMQPPYNGQMMNNAQSPYDGQMMNNMQSPYDGQMMNNMQSPYDGQMMNNIQSPYDNQMMNNMQSPYDNQMMNNNMQPPYNGQMMNNNMQPPYNGQMMNNNMQSPYNGQMMNNNMQSPYNGQMMNNNMQPPYNGQMMNNNMQPPYNGQAMNNTQPQYNENTMNNDTQIPNNTNTQMQTNIQSTNSTQMPNNVQESDNVQMLDNEQASNDTQVLDNLQELDNNQTQDDAQLISSDNQEIEETQSPINNNEISKVVPELTQKRGRGRPRKILPPGTETTNSLNTIDNTTSELSQTQSIENIQKRKRGRPAKKILEATSNQPNAILNENNNIQVRNNQATNEAKDLQPLNTPQDDVLPGLEEKNEIVDLYSLDSIDDSIMNLDNTNSNPNSTSSKLENDIAKFDNNANSKEIVSLSPIVDDSNLFDLDIEETNTNTSKNNGDNDINSNPYSNSNDVDNSPYENAKSSIYENSNDSPYENMNKLPYENTNNTHYGNMNNTHGNNNSANRNNMQGSYNNLINTQNTTNTNNNAFTENGKIVSFIGTSKNGISFIVNNLAQLLSQSGVKTAILDLTKNKNSYYMYTDNDANLMKKATESMKNLSNGIIDGLNVNNNLIVFTSLPEEIETLNNEVMLQTLSNNFEIVLLDCDFETNIFFFAKSNEIYLVQSMDTFTIQPLTQFLSNLKLKNALDESKLRIIINKYVKLKKLDEKMIIGGMSKYNEPSMTLQRDLFNAQAIKYVCIPFEIETYAKYLEAIAMCNLSLNGYSQNFINSLEELGEMVYPLIAGGDYTQNNTDDKHGLFGNKKSKTQQVTQFSNNVNDTLDKMRTNNF